MIITNYVKRHFQNADLGGGSGGGESNVVPGFNIFADAAVQTGIESGGATPDSTGNGVAAGTGEGTTQPGAPVQPSVPTSVPAVPQPAQSAQPVPASGVAPASQQQLVITPEALREIVGANNQPQQQQAQPQGLTKEEADQRFQVVYPTEQDLNTIFRGGAEGVQALQTLLHNTARMSALISTHHMQQQMGQLKQHFDSQISPAREVAERQMMEQHTNSFYQTFPAFNKGHEPILKNVYNSLLASGFKGSPQQVYAKIAEEATKLIQTVNPAFGQAGQPGQPGQPSGSPTQAPAQSGTAAPQRQMSPMISGAGGAGATPGASSGTRPLAEQIFG